MLSCPNWPQRECFVIAYIEFIGSVFGLITARMEETKRLDIWQIEYSKMFNSLQKEIVQIFLIIESKNDCIRFHRSHSTDADQMLDPFAYSLGHGHFSKCFDTHMVNQRQPFAIFFDCWIDAMVIISEFSNFHMTQNVQAAFFHVIDKVDEWTSCPRVRNK